MPALNLNKKSKELKIAINKVANAAYGQRYNLAIQVYEAMQEPQLQIEFICSLIAEHCWDDVQHLSLLLDSTDKKRFISKLISNESTTVIKALLTEYKVTTLSGSHGSQAKQDETDTPLGKLIMQGNLWLVDLLYLHIERDNREQMMPTLAVALIGQYNYPQNCFRAEAKRHLMSVLKDTDYKTANNFNVETLFFTAASNSAKDLIEVLITKGLVTSLHLQQIAFAMIEQENEAMLNYILDTKLSNEIAVIVNEDSSVPTPNIYTLDVNATYSDRRTLVDCLLRKGNFKNPRSRDYMFNNLISRGYDINSLNNNAESVLDSLNYTDQELVDKVFSSGFKVRAWHIDNKYLLLILNNFEHFKSMAAQSNPTTGKNLLHLIFELLSHSSNQESYSGLRLDKVYAVIQYISINSPQQAFVELEHNPSPIESAIKINRFADKLVDFYGFARHASSLSLLRLATAHARFSLALKMLDKATFSTEEYRNALFNVIASYPKGGSYYLLLNALIAKANLSENYSNRGNLLARAIENNCWIAVGAMLQAGCSLTDSIIEGGGLTLLERLTGGDISDDSLRSTFISLSVEQYKITMNMIADSNPEFADRVVLLMDGVELNQGFELVQPALTFSSPKRNDDDWQSVRRTQSSDETDCLTQPGGEGSSLSRASSRSSSRASNI